MQNKRKPRTRTAVNEYPKRCKCGSAESAVSSTWPVAGGDWTNRKRHCGVCGEAWGTQEPMTPQGIKDWIASAHEMAKVDKRWA